MKRPVHGIRATAAQFALIRRFKKCLEQDVEKAVQFLERLEKEIFMDVKDLR